MGDKDTGNIDDLEVKALSDEELDSVAGGEGVTNVASCTCCSVTTQTIIKPSES